MSLESEEKLERSEPPGMGGSLVAQQHDSEAELSFPKCTCDFTVSMTQAPKGEKRKQKMKFLVQYLITCYFQKENIKYIQDLKV